MLKNLSANTTQFKLGCSNINGIKGLICVCPHILEENKDILDPCEYLQGLSSHCNSISSSGDNLSPMPTFSDNARSGVTFMLCSRK